MSGWLLLVIVSVPLVVLELAAFVEVVVRRPDLSASRRVAWCTALLLVPYVSLLGYVVARPPRHGRQRWLSTRRNEPRAEALVLAAERHVRGELDADGYEAAIDAAASLPDLPSRAGVRRHVGRSEQSDVVRANEKRQGEC